MKFKALRLTNFGPFNGNHTVSFYPQTDRPITLVGALNGSGKTTVLEAIQLAMFGKLAKVKEDRKTSYDKLIRGFHNIYSSEPLVEVSLEIIDEEDGVPYSIEVCRSYKITSHSVVESLTVLKNGEPDNYLSNAWDEYITDEIPVSLSSLFFFDGERIEELAAKENTPKLIKQGIESLLGMDVLDTLLRDLNNLQSDIHKEVTAGNDYPELEHYELELTKISNKQKNIRLKMTELGSSIDQEKLELNHAKRKAEIAGSDLVRERESISFELSNKKSELIETKAKLAAKASELTPLYLIKDSLRDLESELKKEHITKQKQEASLLLSRFSDFLAGGAESASGKLSDKAINEFIERDTGLFSIPTSKWFNDAKLAELFGQVELDAVQYSSLTQKKVSLESTIDTLEQKLSRVPDEEVIAPLLKKVADFEKSILIKTEKLQELTDEECDINESLKTVQTRYHALLNERAKVDFEIKSAKLTLETLRDSKEHVENLKVQLLSDNLSQIERAIVEKCGELFRKSNFIESVSIDPDSYQISLFTTENKTMDPESLSAGERQLLAVCILWAFVSISDREIPMIIDTPLGRLDGIHREKLLTKYFPNAAEQVILLSTDQEIRSTDIKKIEHSLSQAISLRFNESTNTTAVHDEYL